MPLDGISAYFVSKALNEALEGLRVDRVRQPARYDIVLNLRGNGQNKSLLISANPSDPKIYLMQEKLEAPPEAPMFCMLLRKHLQGGKIIRIETEAYERIFKLVFLSSNELGDRSEKTLLFECMGRHSNLILLNEDGVILDAIVHVDSRVNRFREILPARPYISPPAQNKMKAAEVYKEINADHSLSSDFWKLLGLYKNLEKAYVEILDGMSPSFAAKILRDAEIDGRKQASQLDSFEWQRLAKQTKRWLEIILSSQLNPSVFYRSERDKSPFDFHIFDLGLGKSKQFPSLLEMLNYFYGKRDLSQRFFQKQASLLKRVQNVLDHAQKMLLVHLKDCKDSENYAQLKEEGELLLAHLYRVKQGDTIVTVEDYNDQMKKRAIELNPHRSPSWNAQSRFARYTRLKRKNELAKTYLEEDENEIVYLNSLVNSIQDADDVGDLSMIVDEMKQQAIFSKSEKHERQKGLTFSQRKALRRKGQGKNVNNTTLTLGPRRFLSSDGLEIRVGRNNLQNDKLTLRSADKKDLWFHIQKEAGSHVILSCAHLEEIVPERSIEEAAILAAWYSRASKASVAGTAAKTAVDFCPVSHVKKPSGAKPGMVIYDRYQTAYVTARAPEDLLPEDHIL